MPRSASSTGRICTHLDITRPSVEIEVQVFDLPVLCKFVHHVLLCRLLMYVGHKHDPALDSCDGAAGASVMQWAEDGPEDSQRAALVSEVDSTRSKTCSEVTALSLPKATSARREEENAEWTDPVHFGNRVPSCGRLLLLGARLVACAVPVAT